VSPILLLADNASEWTGPTGNNTWLIPGAVPALVDSGVGAATHLAALEEALGGAPLAAILLTHGHSDHVKGVPAILERWPAARVRGPKFEPLRDDERIPAGDGVLRAIHTPGHEPDHFCFFDEASGDLFCGDLARAGGTIVVPANHGGDLTDYLTSLRRIKALGPRRLLPGHGPIVEDVAALVDDYIGHRASREAQIVEALRGGATTPEAIVERVYQSLRPGLVRAAQESVLAHLIKLQREGRASERESRWSLT
jgi:glyoxylase-like metal-dependent hydrolase (beta-lactamase superfamily II)